MARAVSSRFWIVYRVCVLRLWWRRLCFPCAGTSRHAKPVAFARARIASASQAPSARTLGLRGSGAGIEVAAIVAAALYFGREVLIPVTLAMLLSFVLSPLVELLRRIWLGGSCPSFSPSCWRSA